MTEHRFRTTIELHGKTATGFAVPVGVVEALGSARRPRVRVTIGAHTYRSTVAVYGGASMLPLSAENRAAAGVAAGDEVDVTVALDTDPRVVEVPRALAEALAAEPSAQTSFGALSYSRQRALAEQVTSAKRQETRDRRVAKIVDDLTS